MFLGYSEQGYTLVQITTFHNIYKQMRYKKTAKCLKNVRILYKYAKLLNLLCAMTIKFYSIQTH